jgi:hypothetical protein
MAWPARIRNGGRVADRPHVWAPLDAAEAVDDDPLPTRVERQPEASDHRMRPYPRRPGNSATRDDLAV